MWRRSASSAVDVFYVTDLTGAKIVGAARQTSIKRHLTQIFADEETARPAARNA